jgi:MFS family permease
MGAIVGPAIAGFALEPLGVAAIYFIDVASFVAVIIALLAMRHRGSAREKTQISFGAALEGLRFLKRSPLIYSTMLLDFFATFFGASKQLLPIFAAELLGVGARGFGLLYAAEPAGAAVAGAVMSALPPIHRQGRVLIIAVLVYGAAMTIFGLSPWMSLSCAMLALAGASDMVSMVIRQTIRQLNTPDELRGRMTSVNMLFFMGGPQLGEVEAGFLAGALGARFSVTSGGVACIIATLAIALLIPALPRYLHKKA